MKKQAIALITIMGTAVTVAIVVWFVQHQFNIVHNENDSLRVENKGLQDKNRDRYYENKDLESRNDELVKQLGDLTKQLALARPLRVEITAFLPEAHWSDSGSVLGVPRASNVFNVTVCNNDVVAVSGLELTVTTLSGKRGGIGGWVFQNRIDLLRAGEERVIVGASIVDKNSLNDLLFFAATIKSGDTIVDEFRLPLNAVSTK